MLAESERTLSSLEPCYTSSHFECAVAASHSLFTYFDVTLALVVYCTLKRSHIYIRKRLVCVRSEVRERVFFLLFLFFCFSSLHVCYMLNCKILGYVCEIAVCRMCIQIFACMRYFVCACAPACISLHLYHHILAQLRGSL